MSNPVIPELKEFLRKHEAKVASGEFELKQSFRYLMGCDPKGPQEPSRDVLRDGL